MDTIKKYTLLINKTFIENESELAFGMYNYHYDNLCEMFLGITRIISNPTSIYSIKIKKVKDNVYIISIKEDWGK